MSTDPGSEVLVTEEASSWVAGLPPDRREAIKALHRLRPAWNLVAVVFAALWAGAAWAEFRFPIWPVRAAAVLLIGACVHSLAILMHEGIHGNFFRNRTLDRWAGFVFGAPALFSCTAYRVTHLFHHRFNRTARDPDEFGNLSRNRVVLSVAFYAWWGIGMAAYIIHVPVTALIRGSRAQKMAVVLEMGLLAALYGALFWAAIRGGFLDVVLWAWVYPMGVAAILGSSRGWAEHMMTRAGHPLTQTRTVTSNRVVSFFMCNLNYHLEHHLFPAIPWYNLPRLHTLMRDDYARAGAFIERSYLRFLWDAFRGGVHVETRRVREAQS
jgi:fatty acid desaturase